MPPRSSSHRSRSRSRSDNLEVGKWVMARPLPVHRQWSRAVKALIIRDREDNTYDLLALNSRGTGSHPQTIYVFSYVLKVLELRDLYSVRACVRACVRHRILRFLPGSAKRPRPGSGALHKVDIVLQTQCDVESILVWYIEQSMSILTDTVRGLSSWRHFWR